MIDRVLLFLVLLLLVACDDDKAKPGGAPSAASSAAPIVSTSAPTAAATPTATASAAPRSDCPKGSSGPGTFEQPCEAKGASRLMTVESTGKFDDKGAPQFRVTNKHSATILYGKVVAYFYDKAGKQLEAKDASGKARQHVGCGGNIFGGVMKPSEKAVVSFSCVKKSDVPDGTATIEAEISAVGFADSTEKKSEFYWKNDDLTPDTRKKGGVK